MKIRNFLGLLVFCCLVSSCDNKARIDQLKAEGFTSVDKMAVVSTSTMAPTITPSSGGVTVGTTLVPGQQMIVVQVWSSSTHEGGIAFINGTEVATPDPKTFRTIVQTNDGFSTSWKFLE